MGIKNRGNKKEKKKKEPEPEPDADGDEDSEEDLMGDQTWAQSDPDQFSAGVDDMFADLFGANPNAAIEANAAEMRAAGFDPNAKMASMGDENEEDEAAAVRLLCNSYPPRPAWSIVLSDCVAVDTPQEEETAAAGALRPIAIGHTLVVELH